MLRRISRMPLGGTKADRLLLPTNLCVRAVTSSTSTTVINKNVHISNATPNRYYYVEHYIKCPVQLAAYQQQRRFSSRHQKKPDDISNSHRPPTGIRFSTLLSKHLGLSRRQSERMILTERVTLFGKIISSPTYELFPSNDPNQDSSTAMKVDGKLVTGIDKTLISMYNNKQQQLNNEESTSTHNSNGKGRKEKPIDNHEYANTRIWLANKLKGELITEVSVCKDGMFILYMHAQPPVYILIYYCLVG